MSDSSRFSNCNARAIKERVCVRVENTFPVGLVGDFPKEQDAWREVDRPRLLTCINSNVPFPARIRFDALAEHYLKADFGADAVRPKSENTVPIVEHYVRDYLVARFGDSIAEDVKPLGSFHLNNKSGKEDRKSELYSCQMKDGSITSKEFPS